MRAVILAGELGCPLKPVVPDRLKPMAEIAGKPFLEYQTQLLRRFNVRDIVLCVGHRHEQIQTSAGIGEYKRDCACRKPGPGMLLETARDFEVDLQGPLVMGDKACDLKAGHRAGCRTILVLAGYGAETRKSLSGTDWRSDFIASDLSRAVAWILASRRTAHVST